MNKENFKTYTKIGKDALTDIYKEYDYLSDDEKDKIISLIRPVIALAQHKRCKYYERYFRLIPLFDFRLKDRKYMSYSEFKQWHKDNINEYIDSCHVSAGDIENKKELFPLKTKEYYEHYKRWFTGKRD